MWTHRHSDWTVTLVFLVLDLMDLTYHATGGVEPRINKYWTAAMMPLMVFFGGVYRFYANELRGKTLKPGEQELGNIDCAQIFVGAVSYIISCVIFGVVITNILDPINHELCPTGATPNSDGKCPITDPKLKNDADAVMVLTLVWIGYPVVSILSRLYLPTYGFPKSALVSVLKDIAYAVLDVVAKGGLAVYVCYRTTWI